MAKNAAIRRASRTPRDITPEDYRCKVTGDDNADKMMAALQAAADEGLKLDLRGKTYVCRSQIVLPPDQRIWIRSGALDIRPDTPVIVTGSTNLMSQSNTPWPVVGELTADALRGSSTLAMSTVAGLATGERAVIFSDKEMTGYPASYSRASDSARVRAIDGSTVTLYSRLQTDFLEEDVAAVLQVLETGGVTFENFTIIGGGEGLRERGFTSEYAFGNRYLNFTGLNLERSGLGEAMCMFSRNEGLIRYEGTLAREAGYGVSSGSCFNVNYGDIFALRSRHALTQAAPSALYNRLSGRGFGFGKITSLEATGSGYDQHPGAPPARGGDVECEMHNDADRSSPAVTVQGGGATLGRVYGRNGSAGGIGFQCLGWFEYPGFVPTVRALSLEGDGNSGMLTCQNLTNRDGTREEGQQILLRVGEIAGDWVFGIRAQAYYGHAVIDVGPGDYTCFSKAIYLQSSAVGRALVYLTGSGFDMTSPTVTPVILQGDAWADTHDGELGCEVIWRRGRFSATKKEIANSRGLVRADDLDEPPNTSIYQAGGQAESPVRRWVENGLLGAFSAEAEGIDLDELDAAFSIGGYRVLGPPRLGFKAPTGNAEPDGSSINTEALTLPAGTAAADGSALDIATITASDANLRAVLAFVKAIAAEQQKHARHQKAYADAGLAHGYIRFTDVLPPVNLTPPTISGIPAVGEVLTLTRGTYTNSPSSYTQQWYSGDTPIGGETATTYTQVSGDLSFEITCRELPSNGSDQPAVAVASNIVYTGRPYIIEAPVLEYTDLLVGSTILCPTGNWGNTPTSFAYQGFRGIIEIGGETDDEHDIVPDDDGSLIRYEVTATNTYGSVTVSSDSVGPIEVGWTLRDMPGIDDGDWWYADSLTDGAVASWPGVIAGTTLAQATGGNRPDKDSTTLNGHPAVVGGTTKWLELVPAPGTFATGSSDGWMFAVIKVGSSAGGNIMAYGFSSSTTGRYLQQQALLPDGINYTLRASSPLSPAAALTTPTLPAYAILFGQWRSNGTVDLWCNGELVQTSAPGTIATLATRFRLFAGAGNSAGTTWTGAIAHVAVGTGAPEVADINRAMGLGAWWCDLQEFLPEDHPYKHVAPWEV